MGRTWEEDEALPLRFLFFALAGVVVPWTAILAWWLWNRGRSEIARVFPEISAKGHQVRHCQTSVMVSKRNAEMQHLKSRRHTCNFSLVFQVVCLAIFAAWLFYVGLQFRRALKQNALYEGFDPYRILGVDKTTGDSDINKAFRREALKYHPDKNPNNPTVAEKKFLLARKAVEALLEPEAMENFKKYGNPDGPQFVMLFAVSSFIKDKEASRENGKLTYKKHWFRAADLQIQLAIAIFCMLGGPVLLWKIFSLFEGDSVDGCRSLFSTKTVEDLTEGLRSVKDATDARELLLQHVEERGWCRRRRDSNCAILFFAHVHRRQEGFDASLANDLDQFLARAHCISRAMVELAVELALSKAVAATIELQRCLLQALDPDMIFSDAWPPHQLLQLPHIKEESVRMWQDGDGRAKSKLNGGLRGFLDLHAGERKALTFSFDTLVAQDIEEFSAVAPCMEISSATVSPSSGKEILEGGMARLRTALRRKNLAKGQAAGSAHSPMFPSAAVAETWWVVFELPDGTVACKRISDREREVLVEIEFEVPDSGKCKCKVTAMCEVYAGLDVERQVVFTALA